MSVNTSNKRVEELFRIANRPRFITDRVYPICFHWMVRKLWNSNYQVSGSFFCDFRYSFPRFGNRIWKQAALYNRPGTLNLSDSFLEVSCTFYRILFSCTPLEAYISGLKVKASDNSCIVVWTYLPDCNIRCELLCGIVITAIVRFVGRRKPTRW